MAQTARNGRQADPVSVLTQAMRRVVTALAMAQVAEDKAGGGNERDSSRLRAERPRRRRGMTSAEWREERRRVS
jgi:hypothetical protein